MVLYCSRHHIGLFFVLAGFVCWISLRDPDFSKPVWPESIYKLGKMLLVCCFVTPLGWTATHMYFDAKSKGFSETAQFLKEKNLLDKQIFGKWQKRKLADGTVHENIYVLPEAMKLSMYLGKNVVANFHMGTTKAYCGGEFTDGNFEISLNKWRAAQKPQVLLGRVDLNEIWPEYENLLGDYVPVYESSSQDFWKFNFPIKIFLPVFAHKDILQDYHLSRVETHDMEEL
jgi:hypothetical protein